MDGLIDFLSPPYTQQPLRSVILECRRVLHVSHHVMWLSSEIRAVLPRCVLCIWQSVHCLSRVEAWLFEQPLTIPWRQGGGQSFILSELGLGSRSRHDMECRKRNVIRKGADGAGWLE
jgi:hypothetical protein